MTQTNITQSTGLLAEFQLWAELEPDRCRKAESLESRFEVLHSDDWRPIWAKLLPLEAAIVQAVVQEAIAVKGWELCFEFDRTLFPDAPWSAVVSQQGNESSLEAAGLSPVFEASAPEPAIALLSAYLQALQAERAKA